ncbi:hypothetical protein [Methanonatronarchaeum sp. AMET-Sl]|uniref:hypothetical protein n=1 Tax=Methanonatronarchaeum sp. AMET-Sl TaxID=3037654 RepID=UPI00244E50AB|nr:hypothetical protein [Methanonatronarchaeum sp. AMET-Sl]WGI17845.1 hypothetical protein QEN48_02235 [Methanonatronarchaeum sp. AMET-Sl]
MAKSMETKPNEGYLGSIPVDMKGFIFSKPYTLVLTQDKTVFARVTSTILKQHAKNARQDVEEKGGGRMDKVKNQMNAHFNHHKKYRDMTLNEVLNESEKNFSIDNNSVQKIKIKKYTVNRQEFPETKVKIMIKTDSKKYKLILNETMDLNEAKTILKNVYGSKVR